MLSLNNIQEIFESGKPVVWTLHDMWECTAICHHAHTCTLFKSECRNCRFLRFPGNNDLAHRVFKKKQNYSVMPAPEYRRSQHMAFLTNTAKHPT